MATILSGPNGLYDLAEEALGPLRREINRDKGKRMSIAGVGCTVYPTHGPIVYAPKPNNERPDLGIEDAPNFRDLQRFSTEYSLMAMQVNTASRLESSGVPGCIHLSRDTYELVQHIPVFNFRFRGPIQV